MGSHLLSARSRGWRGSVHEKREERWSAKRASQAPTRQCTRRREAADTRGQWPPFFFSSLLSSPPFRHHCATLLLGLATRLQWRLASHCPHRQALKELEHRPAHPQLTAPFRSHSGLCIAFTVRHHGRLYESEPSVIPALLKRKSLMVPNAKSPPNSQSALAAATSSQSVDVLPSYPSALLFLLSFPTLLTPFLPRRHGGGGFSSQITQRSPHISPLLPIPLSQAQSRARVFFFIFNGGPIPLHAPSPLSHHNGRINSPQPRLGEPVIPFRNE